MFTADEWQSLNILPANRRLFVVSVFRHYQSMGTVGRELRQDQILLRLPLSGTVTVYVGGTKGILNQATGETRDKVQRLWEGFMSKSEEEVSRELQLLNENMGLRQLVEKLQVDMSQMQKSISDLQSENQMLRQQLADMNAKLVYGQFGLDVASRFLFHVFNVSDEYDCPTRDIFALLQEYRERTQPQFLDPSSKQRMSAVEQSLIAGGCNLVGFVKIVKALKKIRLSVAHGDPTAKLNAILSNQSQLSQFLAETAHIHIMDVNRRAPDAFKELLPVARFFGM